MILSTKGRYGIKAMVDLAVDGGETPVSTASLAAKQGISEAYLEQLVSSLKKAKLITSTRGAMGGYRLARDPEEINVGDVLRALEGNTTIIDCVSNEKVDCQNACECSARPLWLKLQQRIDEVLNTTTLKDMADDYVRQMERSTDEKGLS